MLAKGLVRPETASPFFFFPLTLPFVIPLAVQAQKKNLYTLENGNVCTFVGLNPPPYNEDTTNYRRYTEMKKILLIAFSFSLLCMAAAEMTAGVPKKETATETILEFTQEANQVKKEKKEETATILEEPTAQPVAAQSKVTDSKPQENKAEVKPTAQTHASKPVEESIPEETVHAITGEPIPDVVDHAKTGYDGEDDTPAGDPIPVSNEKASIEEAMRVAKEYAVTEYGMIIDTSLYLDNSAYRFPAVVPNTVSQETLNAKAIDMVEFTFQQLMRVDGLTMQDFIDLGFRCNIYTYESNGEFST